LAPPASQEQFTALRRFINGVDGSPFPIEHGYMALLANFLAGQVPGTDLGHAIFVSWDMEERHGTPCEQEAW
jgi:hypothetical protein